MSNGLISDKVVTCRKEGACDQCGWRIQSGDRYRRQVQCDGGIRVYRAHVECDKAALAYAKIAGIEYYDDPPCLLNDITREDYSWLLTDFPEVAQRLSVTSHAASAATESK